MAITWSNGVAHCTPDPVDTVSTAANDTTSRLGSYSSSAGPIHYSSGSRGRGCGRIRKGHKSPKHKRRNGGRR